MEQQQVYSTAQEYLCQEGIPGWLVYDYRQANPVFGLVVSASGHVTRPCYFYLPAQGEPTLLVHHVDAGKFADSEVQVAVYSSRDSMLTALRGLLAGASKVAMEYSPENALPRVSRVDAGTVELVRSLGPEVVSSADLMQYATHQWTPEQLADHRTTADKLAVIVNEAFAYAGEHLAHGVNEFEVAEFIRDRFAQEGIASPDGPIVAVNANASDPHYEPSAERYSAIKQGDWLLIDLWAKGVADGSVYADITWVAYVGDTVPRRQQEIFDIVIGARDAALHYLEDAHNQGNAVQGWQADQVARNFIASHGYGEYFTHRLGHSIGFEVHSEAVNLDGFETHDTRRIIPGICFSIEPGIYLPEFGVRSEIDVFMSADGPYASSPVQHEVVLIKGG
ncbi:MAG TPA: M24 family metallopeptidase [Dehalococcoidia bacterium]|jgi:Xaa-Pro aminopeptidase|nr:M24 family metallopeptidase [Dehalococcoidia bacterium]RUA28420.1 MAG: aminopeptidase P family protein [Chloroflexota bacterium]HIM63153.1 M24 family metallopeptidase [Dehalococcoidia bacterium]HIN23734.1 M24 family metallopeptidase [Dehalococcoidia bacterium]